MEVGGASGVNAGHRDEAHHDAVSHPIGQGFSTKGAASKRRTGSNEKVTNILAHIAMQRESALTRGEKNRVAKKLYLMAAQNPDPEVWAVDKPPMTKTVDSETGFVRTNVDPTYKNKPNVVMVRTRRNQPGAVFRPRYLVRRTGVAGVPAGSAIGVRDSSLNCFADGNQGQSVVPFLLHLLMHPA